MQTLLSDILLNVDEVPAFGVLGSVGVTFEVTAIDVPCAPVTAGVASGVVTSGQRVEERVGGFWCAEDDVGVKEFTVITLGIAAPLGTQFNSMEFICYILIIYL